MSAPRWGRAVAAGLLAGIVARGVVTPLLFMNPFTHALLFDPARQSPKFAYVWIERPPSIPTLVAVLILLTIPHALIYERLRHALPGRTWTARGAAFGMGLWLVLFTVQELAIFGVVLEEPWPLVALELAITFFIAQAEGLTLAAILSREAKPRRDAS